MWQQLRIRTQLVALLGALLTLVALLVLALTVWLDVGERRELAIEQAATLHRALDQDLVRAVIEPTIDRQAELSFRLAGFTPLDALILFDAEHTPVYRYRRTGATFTLPSSPSALPAPELSATHLSRCEALQAGAGTFGSACYGLNLERYHTGLRERIQSLLMLYALALLMGLGLAVWVGRLYTRPFSALVQVMRANDARANRYTLLHTAARNEIGELYGGYNAMIEQIVRATQDLRYLNHHDSLTGVLNRCGFTLALEHLLGQDTDDARTHVLVQLDLDLFRLVNDSAGQLAGDQLLRQVAQLCRDHWPAPAALARIGGDEFFALLPHCDEERGCREARGLLDRIGELRFRWEHAAFDVSASAGLVAFAPGEYQRDELITAVNSALKQAQLRGHQQLHCQRADAERQRRESDERLAANAIKEALRQGPARFELFAQPIVALSGERRALNYEILLRLRTGSGELLSPGLFLPVAEQYQLMSAIDQHVFAAFFEAMTQHPQHLEQLGFASINLSGSTLTHPDFQAWFSDILAQQNFPWPKLVVEVTETTAVGNLPQASDFIARCRVQGVQIALDDFGTGLSSFEYLKSLPFDRVKIDGSFIRDILSDPVDHETVRYIHQIARLREQSTIAEFVETERQLDALRAIGIDYGQGYLLGKPQPLADYLCASVP